ncbi:MAG TPA: hypothetical protein VGE93_08565 [Bryobacteraceae bacterium]
MTLVARLSKLLTRVFRAAIPSSLFFGGQGTIKVKFQHVMQGLYAVLWHLIDEILKLVASRHHAGIVPKAYAI